MSKNSKSRLTQEQMKQLISMQQKVLLKPPPARVIYKFLAPVLAKMQQGVYYLDRFVNFVSKKEDKNRNDVVQAARAPIIFGAYVIIIFLGFGGLWSILAPLNSAAIAPGTVMPDSNKKIIQHKEGGIIKHIFIKQGQRVKKGDKLIEIEDSRIKAQYEMYLTQYRQNLATEARLLAELGDQDIVNWPDFLQDNIHTPTVANIVATQNNLFESKKKLYNAELGSIEKQIQQAKKQIESLKARKIANVKNLEIVSDRVNATQELFAKGFAQKVALLELEAKKANLEADITNIETDIVRTEQEIVIYEIKYTNFHNKTVTAALNELKEAQMQVIESREKFFDSSDALDRTIIKSPVDGIINLLNYHTIGGVIQPGSLILEIAPEDDSLIIEAHIDPKNIDSIYPDLIVKIRFSAFKSRTTPSFTGKVLSVSPDIVQLQQGAAPFYIARIEIDMEEFEKIAKAKKLRLQAGMQAEVQIVTGTRTLLRYLLDPVIDVMFKAFKEK